MSCTEDQAEARPSLDDEYKRFFSLDAGEKAKVPLASLSLYLMICSLGVMMRASLSEMFGHTNRAAASAAAAAGDTSKEPVDMTSSRLQSELYRTLPFPRSRANLQCRLRTKLFASALSCRVRPSQPSKLRSSSTSTYSTLNASVTLGRYLAVLYANASLLDCI